MLLRRRRPYSALSPVPMDPAGDWKNQRFSVFSVFAVAFLLRWTV
jgi:hypothetical protein